MSALNSKIKVVTLDLDNTLWDIEATKIIAEKNMRLWMRDNVPKALAIYKSYSTSEIRGKVLADNPTQIHNLTFLRVEVLFQVIKASGVAGAQARIFAKEAFAVFFKGRNNVVFFPGALEMLELLSHRYKLFSLTNGNADVEQVGIAKFLAGAVSSADVGASKPSREMFEAVINKAGVNADQCIHVGDHLTDDIEGANNAGMHTIWVNMTHHASADNEAKADIEVTSLAALPKAIDDYQLSLSVG